MRYAIVSDIHANLQAWQAVLADIESFPGAPIDRIVCLGDIVGYGPNPHEILADVRARSVATVIGNHDAAACNRMDASLFNDNAREVIEWTTSVLPEDELAYLHDLPDKIRLEDGNILLVHAEVCDPMNFSYILDEDQAAENFAACSDPFICLGHSHMACVFMQTPDGKVIQYPPLDFCREPQNRYIVNPGSVGDPRSEEIVASYVIHDTTTGDVFFRKVNFDTEAYRAIINATPLTTRPFFLRYLDEISQGIAHHDIPTVQETDGSPQFSLSQATMPQAKEKKKKDPFAIVGIIILLLAVPVGIWFASQLFGNKDADTATVAESSSKPPASKSPEPTDKAAAAAKVMPVLYEAESLAAPRRAGQLINQDMNKYGKGVWSNNKQLWWTKSKQGHTIELEFHVPETGEYHLGIGGTKARDYAIIQFLLDRNAIGAPVDFYHPDVAHTGTLPIGEKVILAKGSHTLGLKIRGANPKATKSYMAGLDYILIHPGTKEELINHRSSQKQ